jgi:hypothetical protein
LKGKSRDRDEMADWTLSGAGNTSTKRTRRRGTRIRRQKASLRQGACFSQPGKSAVDCQTTGYGSLQGRQGVRGVSNERLSELIMVRLRSKFAICLAALRLIGLGVIAAERKSISSGATRLFAGKLTLLFQRATRRCCF